MFFKRQEFANLQEHNYEQASNHVMSTKDFESRTYYKHVKGNIKSWPIWQITERVGWVFASEQYKDLLNNLIDTQELSKKEFKTFGIQLMMATILSNGHRAEIGTIMKHADLATLNPHSTLEHMYTIELNRCEHKPSRYIIEIMIDFDW